MAVAPGDGLGTPQRMQDGLLGAVGRGLEQRVEQRVVQQRDRRHRLLAPLRQRVGGGEGQRDVAAAVAEDRAGARQAGAGAQRKAAQLARVERRVGGEQHDDRALLGLGRRALRRCASWVASRAPTARPAISRLGSRPKLASTSAPTVCSAPGAPRREAVPMPPLSAKLDMPRPAPTEPCATASPAAAQACEVVVPRAPPCAGCR